MAFVVVAVALGVAAAVVQPESATPSIFSDQGTAFYPKFTDPQAAKTIEVVDYDESTATATPLKVQFDRGHWVIASHYDYPVEIGDRLAKTAAALIDLKKDIVRSDSTQDQAQLGVVDPLDAKAGLDRSRQARYPARRARRGAGRLHSGQAGGWQAGVIATCACRATSARTRSRRTPILRLDLRIG